MKAAAIVCWAAAWICAGLIPASLFAARSGDAGVARAELAAGVIGAAGLAWAGVALW